MNNQNDLNLNSSQSKPRGNIVFRQELKSLTPKCDAKFAIVFNLILFVLYTIFGIPILIQSIDKLEYRTEYTNCIADSQGYCEFNIEIEKSLQNPVYFYYQIDNFYINHRDFVKSRIYSQLRGETHIDSSNNKNCNGAKFVYEIFDNDTSRYFTSTGNPLNGTDYADPCGLIAKSYFNDTNYTIIGADNKEFFINDTDIANYYDKEFMFKRNKNYSIWQWIDVEDEHFIVWMQMESFDNFRKLWGRINENLEPGNYTIHVKNQYNVTDFEGKKYIILANSTNIGIGRFFGFVLMGGAIYSIVLVILIYTLNKKNKNKMYTLADLKWD